MLLIGIVTYFGLLLLGVPYPLALAVIAGLLEVIPILGPIISVIPAVIVAWSLVSPISAVGVIGLYILIQQLESNLIVPKVMQKVIGFNPLVTLIGFMIGAKLLGLTGAILAIPLTIIFIEVSKYILNIEREG